MVNAVIGLLKAALGRQIETICLSMLKMQTFILRRLRGGFRVRHELNLFEMIDNGMRGQFALFGRKI